MRDQKAVERKELLDKKAKDKELLEKALAESLLWQDRYDKTVEAIKVS